MSFGDKDQIRRLFEEIYPSNVRSADLRAYGAMYTEDALWLPPGDAIRHGPDDIVEGFAKQIADQDIDPIFTAKEIEVIGDFGSVIGMSQAVIYPKDGSKPKDINFRALWLTRKEQGAWKIACQIWNS